MLSVTPVRFADLTRTVFMRMRCETEMFVFHASKIDTPVQVAFDRLTAKEKYRFRVRTIINCNHTVRISGREFD